MSSAHSFLQVQNKRNQENIYIYIYRLGGNRGKIGGFEFCMNDGLSVCSGEPKCIAMINPPTIIRAEQITGKAPL